jgi:hypothetical protein
VIEGPVTSEPDPIWRDAPCLVPGEALPRYRYVPGLNPHPVRDEDGHSFGVRAPNPEPITLKNWRESRDYLLGIDLYHNGYLWESHEAWEELWKLAEDDSLEANFLQALILNSAAQLKAHMANAIGVRTHSQAARWRLARIRSRGYSGPVMRFFGVDVDDLINQIKRHYGLVWESKENDLVQLKGDAPRLVLDLD